MLTRAVQEKKKLSHGAGGNSNNRPQRKTAFSPSYLRFPLPPSRSTLRPMNLTWLLYSILFFPSSALRYRAVLSPRSCRATNGPMSLSLRTLVMASW